MNILIVCINYNSYGELKQFLDSIEKSAEYATDAYVEVIIADNSTMYEEVNTASFKTITVSQQKFDNLGYLGGASAVINNIKDIHQYKYVIISNVDVLFECSTIKQLADFDISDDIAWVAPSIYSEKYKKDLNPNILNRYKYWKLLLLKFTYNRYVYLLYNKLYFSKRRMNVSYPQMDIYAGHGALMILTSNFFKKKEILNYPVFLYGEELYLAELIRNKQMRVVYSPSIKIETIGGVSTSKMPSSNFFHYNKEAIDYILNNFY